MATGLLDYLEAIGETGATLGSGAAATMAGIPYGIMQNIRSGKYGTKEGVKLADKATQDFIKQYTYAPRGQMAQNALQSVAGLMDTAKLPPVLPEAGLLAAIPKAAYASQFERAGMAAERALEPVAANVMARGGLPAQLLQDLTQGTRRQIFIGTKAKTWDKSAADKFLELEKSGIDPVTAWRETGTFRSPDNKLRQEISDQQAKFQPTQWETPYIVKSQPDLENIKMSSIGSAMFHPELFAAYPELANANLLANPYLEGRGQWNRANPSAGVDTPYMQINQTLNPGLEKDWLSRMTTPTDPDYWKNQARYAIKEGFSPRDAIKDMRKEISQTQQKIKDMESGVLPGGPSVALHELQHGVQSIEGFAPGGNPSTVMTKLQQSNPDEYMRLISSSQNLGDIYDNAYRRIAGEVEARAVQKRMNMSPEQRRQVFPLESYDRPVESLLFP